MVFFVTLLYMSNVRVGIAVIIIDNNRVLLGKRRGAHGEGTWGFPGGHLEFQETIYECAKREVLEETDLTISDITFGPYTNDIFEDKHYVTLFVLAKNFSGQVSTKEPQKCEIWEWFEWNNLPQPLFLPIKNLLKTDYNPIE